MRLLTVAEARQIDRDAVQKYGMPSLLLMENAARSVAETARTLGEKFVVLAGTGNNGGDGLAAARHLGRERCAVHLLAEPEEGKAPDAARQFAILRAAGWPVVVGSLPNQVAGVVWIDAIFGTGLDRVVSGVAREWIGFLNGAVGVKLCVDIPSGLHGDSGEVLGAAVRGDVTVTFAGVKVGMTRGAGPRLCGRVVVAGLGLP